MAVGQASQDIVKLLYFIPTAHHEAMLNVERFCCLTTTYYGPRPIDTLLSVLFEIVP